MNKIKRSKKYDVNIVMCTDSYKLSQPPLYPEGMTKMSSYMEARRGVWPKTILFGLQYINMRYFSQKITVDMVEEAAMYAAKHGEPFEYDGWMYIATKLKGKLPFQIKAVKEGVPVSNQNVIVVIDSTDEKVPWIVGWAEGVLMHVWYGSTIATKTYYVKKVLEQFANETSENTDVTFQFHNFGFRGSSSIESSDIAGVAHLTQMMGTDNFHCLKMADYFYFSDCAGYSIIATEHSNITVYGRDGEYGFLEKYVEMNIRKNIIACVMDSYNIFKAVDYITKGTIKEKIESDNYPVFVIRPDSGDPLVIIPQLLEIMKENSIAYKINSKGYIEFNKYRIIWGDGISPATIEAILNLVKSLGYASQNFAFGSGGDLVQNVNRDTQGFALKCSYVIVDGVSVDVQKDPITDSGKKSKAGNNTLYIDENGYYTAPFGDTGEQLEVVFKNGKVKKTYSLDEIRDNSLI